MKTTKRNIENYIKYLNPKHSSIYESDTIHFTLLFERYKLMFDIWPPEDDTDQFVCLSIYDHVSRVFIKAMDGDVNEVLTNAKKWILENEI